MFVLTVFWVLCAVVCSMDTKTIEKSGVGHRGLYDGAQVWKVKLRSENDATLIQNLINMQDISIWQLTPQQALFLVRMEKKLKVNRKLNARALNHTVVVLDVQRRVEEQQVEPDAWDSSALRRGHRMSWSKYPTVEVVNEYMEFLTKNYPSLCKLRVIGRSVENQTIKMLTISNGNARNKAVLLTSGAHAREWIAITSALLVAREIATKFDGQPKYVKDKDWHVIPLLNPDGYRYTYTHDRFWRKNRSLNNNSDCYGVDLNRNFDTGWAVKGVTEKQPCAELYSGTKAFSEPESKALRNTVQKLKSKLAAVVDLHSFGQTILFPWSYKPDAATDHSLLNTTAAEMCAAMHQFKKRKYTYGQTYQNIYPAAGSILDWMYSTGIKLSFVIEGRDRGDHGFLLPPVYIQEAGLEMLVAVTRLAEILDRQIPKKEKGQSLV